VTDLPGQLFLGGMVISPSRNGMSSEDETTTLILKGRHLSASHVAPYPRGTET